jgi:hypothetical protein
MQRHDTRPGETTRAAKPEAARTPGKHTLVDGLASNEPSRTRIEATNEAAKGGTDVNPKLGTDGGDAGDGHAQDAHAHEAGAAGDHRSGAASTTIDPRTTASTGRRTGEGVAPATGQASPANSGQGTTARAPAAAPATTGDAANQPKAEKAEFGLAAIFGGSSRATSAHAPSSSAIESSGDREAKQQAVKPTASPTFHGAAGANNCIPGDATGASIAWTVVTGATTWGVSVTSFTTTGTINVAPWPSKPTEMVTPNTANPVDGGNIENKPGSNNHWKFATKEMQEYNQSGGGRSSYWHSYEASKAHEWEHWNTDWLKGIVEPLWPAVNTDLDAITIPKADAADEAAARPLLQAKIDVRMKTFDRELTRKWNAVPDSPGLAGANGYTAGQKVLDKLIAAVEAYAKTKGW